MDGGPGEETGTQGEPGWEKEDFSGGIPQVQSPLFSADWLILTHGLLGVDVGYRSNLHLQI